jgi:hypothetical protein
LARLASFSSLSLTIAVIYTPVMEFLVPFYLVNLPGPDLGVDQELWLVSSGKGFVFVLASQLLLLTSLAIGVNALL